MSVADQRITAALPLVGLITRSVATALPRHIDIDELRAAGTLGLVEAAGRYDESRGVPFEMFARRRIEGAILDAARRHDFASRTLRRWGRSIQAAQQAMLQELGRQPTAQELAARLVISPRKLSRLQASVRDATVLRLEPTRTGDDDLATTEVAGDDDPAGELVHREQLSLLADGLAALPERLRHVVQTTYLEGRPLAEVAADLGVTESRVSQLRNEALSWLRQLLEPAAWSGSPRQSRIAVWGKAVASTRPWRERIAAVA